MTDKTQPEALRLAHIFDHPIPPDWPDMVAAAAELRRQHARIAELEAQLEAVGAGGVQALSAGPAEQQVAPSAVLKAIREANMQLVRTGDDAFMLVPYKRATAEQQAAPKAAPGKQFDADGFRAWVLQNLPDETIIGSSAWWADHLTTWAQRFVKAAPQQEAQEPVWDGKLSDAMRNALDALYLQCGHEIARDISHQVRKECEAIYTSYTTAKRMYQAARDRLGAIETAQPQPDPFAVPQPAPAPLSDEREAFEAWFRQEYHSRLDRNMPDKSYNDPKAYTMWIAWQARAALAAQGGK